MLTRKAVEEIRETLSPETRAELHRWFENAAGRLEDAGDALARVAGRDRQANACLVLAREGQHLASGTLRDGAARCGARGFWPPYGEGRDWKPDADVYDANRDPEAVGPRALSFEEATTLMRERVRNVALPLFKGLNLIGAGFSDPEAVADRVGDLAASDIKERQKLGASPEPGPTSEPNRD